FHLAVVAPENKPLGTRDAVVARISAALPELRWAEGPSSFDEMGMLASLGEYELGDIAVKPFRVEQDGYLFSLVYERRSYDDPDNLGAGYECVMLWPNDIMFHPPWDSGHYST